MKITASGLSVASGILTIPPTIAWYLDHTDVIHLPHNLDNWMLGIAAALLVVAMISNAVAHSRWERLFKRQAATQNATGGGTPTQFQDVDKFYRLTGGRFSVREPETPTQLEIVSDSAALCVI